MPGPFSVDPFSDLALDDDPDVDGSTLTITRTSGLNSSMAWVDNVSANTVKTVAFTRVGGSSLIATVTTTVYRQDGTTIGSQKVETITRTAGKATSIVVTRPV